MNKLVIQNIIRALVLIFFQISVLNNVYLGGYANVFLYILFVFMLPTSMSKVAILFISFFAGLSVDVFSSSLGIHAFSATLMGFVKVMFADNMLVKRDNTEIDTPSVKNVPISTYSAYTILLTFVYSFSYYMIESFLIDDIFNILIRTALTTIVSYLLIISCEFLFLAKKKR